MIITFDLNFIIFKYKLMEIKIIISVTARYFILLRQKPNTQKSLHLAKEKIIIIEQRRRRSRNLINGRLRFDDDLITITLNSDRAL